MFKINQKAAAVAAVKQPDLTKHCVQSRHLACKFSSHYIFPWSNCINVPVDPGNFWLISKTNRSVTSPYMSTVISCMEYSEGSGGWQESIFVVAGRHSLHCSILLGCRHMCTSHTAAGVRLRSLGHLKTFSDLWAPLNPFSH